MKPQTLKRGKTVVRIRGRHLQKIRNAHFLKNPLCVMCLAKGKITAATELDHNVPLHQEGTETDDNRQGLCSECHLQKSKEERGHLYKPRLTIGLDGWPIA